MTPHTLASALEEIAAHLAEDRDAQELPGLSVAIVADGAREAVWSAGFGLASHPDVPARGNTIYRVSTLAKPLIATALLRLRDGGRLSLEDPLSKWLPEAQFGRPGLADTITLRQLAGHASGLPPLPPVPGMLEDLAFPDRSELLASLDDIEPALAPGTGFSFSTLGPGLLAMALTRAADRPLQGYIREHVLTPLGMHDTGWVREDLPQERIATGHLPFGDPDMPRPESAPSLKLGALAPVLGLWSTAEDLARFAAFHLRSDPRNPPWSDMPLGVESLQEMHAPAAVDTARRSGAALGWLLGLVAERSVLFHGAADVGFSAYVALSPRAGTAVALAANRAANPQALGEMAHGVLRALEDSAR